MEEIVGTGAMSKGSAQRPLSVSQDEYACNFERTFGKAPREDVWLDIGETAFSAVWAAFVETEESGKREGV